jgi:hypothetical protein
MGELERRMSRLGRTAFGLMHIGYNGPIDVPFPLPR